MAVTPPPAIDISAIDQRVTLTEVSWEGLEAFLAIRGELHGTRMVYIDGVLELMTPSLDHEGIHKIIGRLLEIWALERRVELNGFGSWTLKNRRRRRSLEPDECYSIGPGRPERPDLAIDVIWTSGGIDKLEVYRGLDVPEVWIWREGHIEVHVLVAGRYERREASAVLPELDLAELVRHIDIEHQTDAVRRYRDALHRA